MKILCFYKKYFLIVFFLGLLNISNIYTQEPTKQENQSGKCAQNAVYVLLRFFGKPMDWQDIDVGLSTKDYVSLYEIRGFLEKQGMYCHSVKFHRKNLTRVPSFLKNGMPDVIAIAAVQSLNSNDKHYLLITKSDIKTIHFLEPYQIADIPVEISKLPTNFSLDVLFVTQDHAIVKEWNSSSYSIYTIVDLFASHWMSIGVVFVLLIILFYKYMSNLFLTVIGITKILGKKMIKSEYRNYYVLPIIIVFCVALIFFNQHYGKSVSEKYLVFEPQSINFGRQPIGKKHPISFKINNVSNRDVKIDDIKTSCSCIDFHLDQKIIPKGQSIIANLHLNVSQIGKSENHVLVSFNDSKEHILLPIECYGYESIAISPSAVNIGVFPSGKQESRDFDFNINEKFDFSSNNTEFLFSGKPDCFSASVISCTQNNNATQVKIRINSSGSEAVGFFDKSLTIQVNNAQEQVFVVKLIGEITDSLTSKDVSRTE
jgi:hypothetical protein